jgi:hypothetical protein
LVKIFCENYRSSINNWAAFFHGVIYELFFTT